MNNPALNLTWGIAQFTHPVEPVAGDDWLVDLRPPGALAAVIDGLGHGQRAATPSTAAVAALRASTARDPITLIEVAHKALARTRGAVMTVALLDTTAGQLHWAGVGNVRAILLHADGSREHMHAFGGVVGYRLPRLRAFTTALYPGDTLVLATDGLRSSFTDGITPDQPAEALARSLLATYKRGHDDALVLVIRVAAAA
jgi:serine phosphatase RsbU (regulator of sigma subunit)